MKKLLLFSCLFSVFITFGQYDQAEYDSLHKQLKIEKTSSEKVKLLLGLAKCHISQSSMKGYDSSIDSSFFYLKKAEDIAQKLNSKTDLAEAFIHYSTLYVVLFDPDKSMDYAQKAIDIFENRGDKKGVCRAYRAYFMCYYYVHSIEDNIALTEKILALCIESGDHALIGRAYEDLIECYHMNTDFVKIVDYLNKALHHYELAGEKKVQSAYCSLSTAYTYMGEYDKALDAMIKSLNIIEQYQVKHYYNMTIYINAGTIYKEMGKLDQAAAYINKAYNLGKLYEDLDYDILIARQMVSVLYLLNKKETTLKYLEEIEKKYDLAHHPYREHGLAALVDMYSNYKQIQKADLYANMANMALANPEGNNSAAWEVNFALAKYYFLKGNYTKSKASMENFLTLVGKSNIKSRMREAYNLLFKLDSIKGDYLSAIKHKDIANAYRDSIFNEAKNWQMAELDVKYQTGKKEKDNELLRKQGELQQSKLENTTLIKNYSILGLAILFIVILIVYYRYRVTQKLRKDISVKNKALEKLITEKEWLIKEIHHRVKNNLQVVMSLLNSQAYYLDDKEAKDAIKNSQHRIHSMSLIHKKLYETDIVTSVNMAVYFWELVEYYKVAFDTKNRIQFMLSAEPVQLDSCEAVPLGLILNEAVNNALKHAFPNNQEGIISISFKREDDFLILSIKDNGIGINENMLLEETGTLGLKLIKGFSRELNADLEFRSRNGLEISVKFKNSGDESSLSDTSQSA